MRKLTPRSGQHLDFSPNSACTIGVLADNKARKNLSAARASKTHRKCCQNLGNINISEKNDAVAAKRWSLAPRRCSHSNFIFGKPYKTNEILILFVSKSHFPYKNQ